MLDTEKKIKTYRTQLYTHWLISFKQRDEVGSAYMESDLPGDRENYLKASGICNGLGHALEILEKLFPVTGKIPVDQEILDEYERSKL